MLSLLLRLFIEQTSFIYGFLMAGGGFPERSTFAAPRSTHRNETAFLPSRKRRRLESLPIDGWTQLKNEEETHTSALNALAAAVNRQ
jgi:hypothetical protein